MHYLALFFIGAFFSNCLPHLTSGSQGRPFPTPFATPHGVGDSSPLVNVLWGLFNLLMGLFLLANNPVTVSVNPDFAVVLLGALLLAVFAALHFGKVQASKNGA